MFFNYIGYYITNIIHGGIVAFIAITPFISNSKLLLSYHSIASSTIFLHWKYNDDNCVLTLIEQYFRKLISKNYNKHSCFTYKIIAPIYNFNNNYNTFNFFSYFLLLSLSAVSYGKLVYMQKYNIINFYNKYQLPIDMTIFSIVINSIFFMS